MALSAEGLQVIDAAVTEHAANVGRLISALAPEERQALDHALRTLLRAVG